MWYLVIGLGVTAVVGLLMWFRYMSFCQWLVEKTNDPTCLHDAAVAARAFPGAGVAGAIATAFRPDPVGEVGEAVHEIVRGDRPDPGPADSGSPTP